MVVLHETGWYSWQRSSWKNIWIFHSGSNVSLRMTRRATASVYKDSFCTGVGESTLINCWVALSWRSSNPSMIARYQECCGSGGGHRQLKFLYKMFWSIDYIGCIVAGDTLKSQTSLHKSKVELGWGSQKSSPRKRVYKSLGRWEPSP